MARAKAMGASDIWDCPVCKLRMDSVLSPSATPQRQILRAVRTRVDSPADDDNSPAVHRVPARSPPRTCDQKDDDNTTKVADDTSSASNGAERDVYRFGARHGGRSRTMGTPSSLQRTPLPPTRTLARTRSRTSTLMATSEHTPDTGKRSRGHSQRRRSEHARRAVAARHTAAGDNAPVIATETPEFTLHEPPTEPMPKRHQPRARGTSYTKEEYGHFVERYNYHVDVFGRLRMTLDIAKFSDAQLSRAARDEARRDVGDRFGKGDMSLDVAQKILSCVGSERRLPPVPSGQRGAPPPRKIPATYDQHIRDFVNALCGCRLEPYANDVLWMLSVTDEEEEGATAVLRGGLPALRDISVQLVRETLANHIDGIGRNGTDAEEDESDKVDVSPEVTQRRQDFLCALRANAMKQPFALERPVDGTQWTNRGGTGRPVVAMDHSWIEASYGARGKRQGSLFVTEAAGGTGPPGDQSQGANIALAGTIGMNGWVGWSQDDYVAARRKQQCVFPTVSAEAIAQEHKKSGRGTRVVTANGNQYTVPDLEHPRSTVAWNVRNKSGQSDLHGTVTYAINLKHIITHVLPALDGPTLFYCDNASVFSKQDGCPVDGNGESRGRPGDKWTISDLRDFLVAVNPGKYEPLLQGFVDGRSVKVKKEQLVVWAKEEWVDDFALEEVLRRDGMERFNEPHILVFQPPRHPKFNAIEEGWGTLKPWCAFNRMAHVTSTGRVSQQTMGDLPEAYSQVTPERAVAYFSHSQQVMRSVWESDRSAFDDAWEVYVKGQQDVQLEAAWSKLLEKHGATEKTPLDFFRLPEVRQLPSQDAAAAKPKRTISKARSASFMDIMRRQQENRADQPT
jgi:hypothetical protein